MVAPEEEIIVSLNGQILQPEDIDIAINPNDSVVMWCSIHGGDALRQLAFFAITIIAVIAAPWLVTNIIGLAATSSMYGAAVAATGLLISAAGALLINALMPPATVDEWPDSAPNYGWAPRSNQTQGGHALAMLYGKCRFAPTLIAHHLEQIGDQQYYNALYALGGFEFGANAGIHEIFVNGQDSANYTDVHFDQRLGSADQICMDHFDDTWSLTAVDIALDTGADEEETVINEELSTGEWVTHTTTESDVTEFCIEFKFPWGLYTPGGGTPVGPIQFNWPAKLRIEWLDYADGNWNNATVEEIDMGQFWYWEFPAGPTFTKTGLTPHRWMVRAKLREALPVGLGYYEKFRETAPIDPTVRSTTGNAVNRIQVGLKLPGGLYYANDSGGLDAQTVHLAVGIRVTGSSGGWFGKFLTITEATTSTIRRVVDFANMAQQQYDVRVFYRQAPPSGDRYHNEVKFDDMQEAGT